MNLTALGLPAATADVSSLNNILSGYSNNTLGLNFKDLISGLLGQAGTLSDEEKAQAAAEINANPALKAAIFKAVAILNITGNLENIAMKDINSLPGETTLQNIISNEKFTPGDKTLFFKGVKLAAIETMLANALSNAEVTRADTLTAAAKVDDFSLLSGIKTLADNIPVSSKLETEANKPGVEIAINNTPASPEFISAVNKSGFEISVNNTPASTGVETVINEIPVAYDIKNSGVRQDMTPAPFVKPAVPEQAQETLADSAKIISIPDATQPVLNIPEVSVPLKENSMLMTQFKTTIDRLKIAIKDFSEIIAAGNSNQEIKDSLVMMKKSVMNIENQLQGLLGPAVVDSKGNIEDVPAMKQEINNITLNLSSVAAVADKIMAAINLPDVTQNQEVNTATTMAVKISAGITDMNASGNNGLLNAAQTKEAGVKDTLLKIAGLLNEMNGSLEISKDTQFVFGASGITARVPSIEITPEITPGNTQVLTSAKNSETGTGVQKQIFTPSLGDVVDNSSKLEVLPVLVTNRNINQNNSENTAVVVQPAMENAVLPAAQSINNESLKDSNANNGYTRPDINNIILSGKDGFKEIIKQDIIANDNWVAQNLPSLASGLKISDIKNSTSDGLFAQVAGYARTAKEDVVVRQVLDSIENNISAITKSVVKINLKPEHLGQVVIRAEYKDNVLTASVQVSNNDVKEIMKSNLVALKETLSSFGITVDGFDISTMNQNTGSGMYNPANQQHEEWQGTVLRGEQVASTIDSLDIYLNKNSYLNYLA